MFDPLVYTNINISSLQFDYLLLDLRRKEDRIYFQQIDVDLLDAYRKQHWNYCEQAITGLMGRWGGELDTFYIDLLNRVNQHKENGVPEDWNAVIIKDTMS